MRRGEEALSTHFTHRKGKKEKKKPDVRLSDWKRGCVGGEGKEEKVLP